MLLFNQISICKNQKTTEISKHLMLLFNFCHIIYLYLLPSFQNISCYCLTCRGLTRYDKCKISKHLMLLFNMDVGSSQTSIYLISKHLMLLFNRHPVEIGEAVSRFQNISCYCLTNEKSLFLNRFFYKKERFYKLFQYFYQPPY